MKPPPSSAGREVISGAQIEQAAAQWHLDETHVLPREQVDGRRVPEASQRAPLERQLLAPPEPWLLADAQVGGEHEVEQPASLHNRRVTQHPAAGGVRAEKDRLAGEGLPPATVGRREQSEPVAKAVANSIAVRGAILESCHHNPVRMGLRAFLRVGGGKAVWDAVWYSSGAAPVERLRV
eukprot:CAMPEP_0195607944 /NCGR_PEP_ID=MMETSP0815-20121206/8480_1 /TAXON_ID=97485 /ORGANISM="Prymnesium parvum, Strain Texoma1" /LENGTH=179 /DNA_ID=CAMNT_0040747769 /DNA_START=901 /DNA_END=1440 /DNA_ORIENTATION=-